MFITEKQELYLSWCKKYIISHKHSLLLYGNNKSQPNLNMYLTHEDGGENT